MSESAYLRHTEHINGEHTRLSEEFKAVREMSQKRQGNTTFEIGHDFFKDAAGDRAGNAGAFEHGASRRLVLSSRLEADSHAVPSTGGFDVGSDLGTTFRHELGHEVYYSPHFARQKKQWDKATAQHVGTSNVSKYGGTNSSELFAESFAAYTSPNYQRGILPADVEGWMDKHVKGK